MRVINSVKKFINALFGVENQTIKILNQHIFTWRRHRYQYCGLNFKQIKYKRSRNLTSKHQTAKILKIAKIFSNNVREEAVEFF